MKITIKEIPEVIEFVRDGNIIARWFKATGSWQSFTNKVEEDGNWSRFLVFEQDVNQKSSEVKE